MKVLVINCGSSSLKYQVLDMEGEQLLAKGLVERIGMDGSVITHTKVGADEKWKNVTPMPTHKEAIAQVLGAIVDPEHGVLKSMDELDAVGHRVVHAGEHYSHSVVIDDAVLKVLDECSALAPLHNPPNILGIRACQELMPNTPMVAVFDTAFHQTMPAESYIYALPYDYYTKYGVRRYGFHGTSHKYVAHRAAEMLGLPESQLKLITCHLGNGASITAIKNGKVVDTSMGFTPLEGLVMGTRCGDIDPSIMTYVAEKEGLSNEEVNDVMNKQSGVLGISGISSDSIIFTAGVGENDMGMRDIICDNLDNLGIHLDLIRNRTRGKEAVISADDSKVKILLIPTNEELMIARDTVWKVNELKNSKH